MLAAGRRDLLVAESAVPAAREILLQSEIAVQGEPYQPSASKLLAGLLAAVSVVAVVIAVGTLLAS
jgi:hypothetical protein